MNLKQRGTAMAKCCVCSKPIQGRKDPFCSTICRRSTSTPRRDGLHGHIADFIGEFTTENGYPPRLSEIGEAVGLKSISTVQGHLRRMMAAGTIRFEPGRARTVRLVKS